MSNAIPQPLKRKCIVVDKDKSTLLQIRNAARNWYDVLETSDVEYALKLLEKHSDVAVFITNHGAAQFDGIALLDRVKKNYPDVRRVIMTSYLDLSRIIHGLHNGTIQKMVQHPINVTELQSAITPFEAQAPNAAPARPRVAG